MADTKISAMTAATTPLTGAELVPLVQSGVNVKATVANVIQYQQNTYGNYGAFQHNATMTNVTPGTANAMIFGTNDITGHGVSITTDGTNLTNITLANAGVYNIQFSAQLDKTGGGGVAADVYIWLRKNGVDVSETNTRITLQGANTYTVAAWNFFVTAAAGDKFQIMWASSDANAAIVYISPVAYGPVIPSVILTVNQVG